MQTAVAQGLINEPRTIEEDAPETEMEQKPQSGLNLAHVSVSIIGILFAAAIGYLAATSNNAEWKGRMEQRLDQIEKQRAEDKQTWDYIRTQNEVNGKALSEIQAILRAQEKRR